MRYAVTNRRKKLEAELARTPKGMIYGPSRVRLAREIEEEKKRERRLPKGKRWKANYAAREVPKYVPKGEK